MSKKVKKCTDETSVLNTIAFRMAFEYEARAARHPSSWGWKEMKIRPFLVAEDPAESRVKFQQPHTVSRITQGTQLSLVNDLCHRIRTLVEGTGPQPVVGCLLPVGSCGLLADPRHGSYILVDKNLPRTGIVEEFSVSIEASLANPGFKLLEKHKCEIALRVASSLVHLRTRKWLGAWWSSRNLFLVRSNRHDAWRTRPEPFMMLEPNSNDLNVDETILPRRIEPALFSLGIFLLEIAYGRPWDSIEPVTMSGNLSEMGLFLGNYSKAKGLCEAIESKNYPLGPLVAPLYAKAARSCIVEDFSSRGRRNAFEDSTFLADFYGEVICYLKTARAACGLNEDVRP